MTEWLSDNAWWLMVVGMATLLCGVGMMVALAIMMPADHFIRSHRRAERAAGHPMWRILVRVLKNVAGGVLLVAGMILAIPMVPGPGILFIILGLSLTDIPGKRALGRRIVRSPMVLRPINALRARWNRPPLQLPQDHRK
ncbi:MAG: hypothetical protein NTV86_09945 [Planctomycetota bacterium]|nr:hypothetical protein [Planctomycetota bacterium]